MQPRVWRRVAKEVLINIDSGNGLLQYGVKPLPEPLLTSHLWVCVINLRVISQWVPKVLLSGVPDFFDRNKILSGGDLSHYQVPHWIRVFFYFVWSVFIHHNFQFYFELCTYCNILDIYLS